LKKKCVDTVRSGGTRESRKVINVRVGLHKTYITEQFMQKSERRRGLYIPDTVYTPNYTSAFNVLLWSTK